MFIGHYAAAFAAKAVRPVLPLWLLFVAVQVVDFIWAVLVMTGVEKIRIIPGYTPANPLDLYHIPYSHSLVAGIVWSIAFAVLYMIMRRGAGVKLSGVVLGLAVFSHWLADLLVHKSDLPILYGDPKLGFGLWDYFWLSLGMEIGLLVLAFIWFMRVTVSKNRWGNIAPWALLSFMIILQVGQHLAATITDPFAFAAQGLGIFTLLAVLAWQVEKSRMAKRPAT